MNKRILICFVIILLSCGCSKEDEYANYEHYDLKGKSFEPYYYGNGDKPSDLYVLVDLTSNNDEATVTGLFYKVDDNDYILLEKLYSATEEAYNKGFQYQFYENKLYGLGCWGSPMVFEIELNGKDSKLQELHFKLKDSNKGFLIERIINNIKDDMIDFEGITSNEEHNFFAKFRCSLTTYECEMLGD